MSQQRGSPQGAPSSRTSLLRSSPLRTGRDSFPSSGSSTSNASFGRRGFGQQTRQGSHLAPSAFLRCLRDTHLESTNLAINSGPVNGLPVCHSCTLFEVAPTACAVVICFFLISRFSQFSRVKHSREVCLLSRPVMLSLELTQLISAPLQSSIRFFPDLMSAPPSVSPYGGLSLCRERYGFTLFR
jgi:hypothetical protein